MANENIKSDKTINLRRAIKAWREVYHYTDSFYLEDENDNLKYPIYPFRYWSWITNVGKAIEYGFWGIIEYYDICKFEEKEWLWYKKMETWIPWREWGEPIPHQHFNLYIWKIIRAFDKRPVDYKDELKEILMRIESEADIISHWSQNGMYSRMPIYDSHAMPCSVEYYDKIETLCADFMNYIKKIMKLKDEHDIMKFIGYDGNLGYGLTI